MTELTHCATISIGQNLLALDFLPRREASTRRSTDVGEVDSGCPVLKLNHLVI